MEESDWHGITYDPGRRNWKARIHFDGKEQYIGRYSTAYEAALAYDQAARLINETQEISVAARRRTRPLNFPHLRPHDKSLDARLLSIFKITPEVAAAVAAGTTAHALQAQHSTPALGSALHMGAANLAASASVGADPAHDHVLRNLAAAAAAAHDPTASEDDDGAAEAAAALAAMGSMGSQGHASRRRSQQQHSQQHHSQQQQRATAAARWGTSSAAGNGRAPSGFSRAGVSASLQEQQLRPRAGSRHGRMAPPRAEPMQDVLHAADAAAEEDSMVWEATPPDSAAPAPASAPAPAPLAATEPQQVLPKCEPLPAADKQYGEDAAGVQQQQASRPAASLLQPIALFVLRAVFPATPAAAELPPATSSGVASLSNGAAAVSADPSRQQGAAPRTGGSSSSPVSSVAGSGAQRAWPEERVSSQSGSVESEAAGTAAAAATGVLDLTSPREGLPLSPPAPQQHQAELQAEQQTSPQAPLQDLSASVPAANALQSRVHLLLQQLITQCQQRQEQLQQQPAPLPVQHLPPQLRAPDLHTQSWPPQQQQGQALQLSPAAVLQQLLPAVAGSMAAAAPPSAAVSPPAVAAGVGFPINGSGGAVGMLSRIGSSELLSVANSCLHEIIDMRLAVLMAPQHSSSIAVLQAHLAAAQQQRQQGWMASAPGARVSMAMDEAQSALPMAPERIVALSMMRAFLQLVADAAGAQGLDLQAELQSVLGALNQLQQALSGLQRVTAAASVHPAVNAAACLGEWKAANLGLSPRMAIHPAVERFVEML